MAAATVLDVALIRRMLARHRPMAEILARSGATEEQVARVRRNFEIVPVKTPAGQMDWEPHKPELRRLYFEGHTATIVADRFGVSRNSVIGAWSRMNLPPRKRNPMTVRRRTPEEIQKRLETRRQKHAERVRAQRAEAAQEAARAVPERRTQGDALASIIAAARQDPLAPAPDPTPSRDLVPILVRENGKLVANDRLKNSTCRWWVGEVLDPAAGFCPHTAVVGLPYCEAHARKAFQPPAARRPRAPAAPKPLRIPTFAEAESE